MRAVRIVPVCGLAALWLGCSAPQPAPTPVARTVPTSAPTSQPGPSGERFGLPTVGNVFFPAYLPRGLQQIDVVVHFHGAPSVVEREFSTAGLRAVLITVNYGGLSSVYERPFSDPSLFSSVLAEAEAGLKERGLVATAVTWRRVCVSSFSAGFGAVRALLKVPDYFDRIDALYLADTLYAGYVNVDGQSRLDPDDVRDFRRFATAAVAGQKTLLVTHSYLAPGTYAGTHETADDLIAFAHAQRQVVDAAGPAAMRIVSRVDQGNFHVWGCAGTTGEDHMAHLRNMRYWYPRLPLEHTP